MRAASESQESWETFLWLNNGTYYVPEKKVTTQNNPSSPNRVQKDGITTVQLKKTTKQQLAIIKANDQFATYDAVLEVLIKKYNGGKRK